ncbi:MAG TPA: hypothetical protein VFG49_09325 [Dyella sp.]|uniref:hypothetical protein n=1 Tax=Dyella sp. TaxID=1869338 RepID=UPI002D79D2D3|nr:hypothetical protein [Dyella sp.]HET6553725.1 hypothetical protein [Dyella sp.]
MSAAASVILDDPTLADMASTALMVAGPEGFRQATGRMGLGCALLLGHDGILRLTPGMKTRLHGIRTGLIQAVSPGPARRCRIQDGQVPEAVLPPNL